MRCSSSIIILLLVFVFGLFGSAHAADKIRIGFPAASAQMLSLPLGQKRGFFQREGLEAELIQIRPNVAVAALVSGELDYFAGIGTPVPAAIQGVPVKVVACYVPGAPIALIARAEFKSVQELRGKTVGINTFGGALEITARLLFKHFGLDPDKEIKFLTLRTIEARFGAMKQGLTAATIGTPPMDFLGKKMGFVVLARANELFSYPVSGLVASVKKINEKPDEIKRVIKAGIKANRYIRQNREGTIEVMMEWIKIDKEMARDTYESVWKAFNEDGSVPQDGLRLVIEQARKANNVTREVSFNEVADLSILKEAQKELGIKGR